MATTNPFTRATPVAAAPPRKRRFGSTGVDVAVVGQGTWNMESDRAASVAALRRGFELGLTHVDTAEMYGSGAVEEVVGEAIAGRRDEIFLVSKVLPSNASHDRVIRSCERSLRRLGTDRLDVYLLHWRSGSTPLAETVGAFEELVKAGKIRAWGVSNFDVDDMAELFAAAATAGAGRCACNQVLLHLEERYAAGKLRAVCDANDVALVAYSPLGSGSFPPRARRNARPILDEIAGAHGVSVAAVALAFLGRDAFVIPKASSIEHVAANAQAAALSLSEAEASSLAEAFPVEGKRLGMI